MSSPHQDAWLKTTLGLDTAAASPGAPLPAPGPDKQSQEFFDKFKAALGPLDEALTYLNANAEASKATGIGGKRIGLVAQYQQAVGKIDPADESKGKPGIDQALGQAQAAAAEAGTAKAAAEKALADWKAQEPQAAAADDQLSEMEAWGHPKAQPLQAPLDAVLAQATARQYDEACKALAAYLPTVKPVWDDYQTQKAAQGEYDAATPDLQRRVGETQKSEFKTLEAKGQEIATAQDPMQKDADAHDYVAALDKQKAMTGQVDAYEKAIGDLRQKKQDYDAAVKDLTPKLDAAKGVDHPSLAPMQKELEDAQVTVDKAGQDEDFEKGTGLAQDLSTKADNFNDQVKQLEQEKKEYDDAMNELRPRLTAASGCAFKQVAGEQKGIEADGVAIEDCAKTEDYKGGIALSGPLRDRLDAFDKLVLAITAQKKAFDDGRKDLQDKLDEAGKTPHPSLTADKTAIDGAVGPMDKAATDEDYDTAGTSMADLTPKVDKYLNDGKALDEKKADYDGKYGELKKKLDEFNVTSSTPTSPMLDDIHKGQTQIEELAAKEDYDGAEKQIEIVSQQFEAFKAANDQVMYSLSYDNKTYLLNEKELAELKARLFRIIMDPFTRFQSQADYYEGVYNDMKTLNDNNLVISFVVETAGGANFGPVTQAIAAQKQAIAAFVQAAANDPKSAAAAFKAAVDAVNNAGSLLFTYREKLFSGGETVIKVGLFIEAVSFGILAAAGGAALISAGVGVAAAGAISSGGAALLEASAQQGAHVFDDRAYDWGTAGKAIATATIVNALAGAAGGKLGAVLAPKVAASIAVKLGLEEAQKEVLEKYVEGHIGGLIQAAIANTPGLMKKELTIGEFALVVAGTAIGGGIGNKIAPGLKGVPVKA